MWSLICNGINACIDFMVSILPRSPFQYYIQKVETVEWLGYLNYFVPISTFIVILQSWVACIAVYYVYVVVMRWAKIVGE